MLDAIKLNTKIDNAIDQIDQYLETNDRVKSELVKEHTLPTNNPSDDAIMHKVLVLVMASMDQQSSYLRHVKTILKG